LDGGMEGDHGAGHGLAGGVGVEAAINLATLGQQRVKPAGVGPDTRGGETAVLWMEGQAADGVDGRLAQDDGRPKGGRNGEEAQVLLGTGGHAPPGVVTGCAEFGADRNVIVGPQEEDGIGSVVRVKSSGLDERIDQEGRKPTLKKQILSKAAKLSEIGQG